MGCWVDEVIRDQMVMVMMTNNSDKAKIG